MFCKRIAIIFLLLPVSLCLPSREIEAQFDVRLSPILQELEIGPGAKKTFKILVNNEGLFDTVSIRAYPGDMIQEQVGSYA
ncbi:MAG: hypothetical protein GTO24_18910, partial [candidate division Zixibacteria bacterium]|nr:hypothetical protein [candidate division Zixibacteria bacterium]